MDRKRTMPVWLDWAIRPNGASAFTCSDAMKSSSSSYACKSQHSSCVDAVNGPGYTCDCSHGYESMDAPVSMQQAGNYFHHYICPPK